MADGRGSTGASAVSHTLSAVSHGPPGRCLYARGLCVRETAGMLEDDICRVAFADAFMVRQLLMLLPNAVVEQLDLERMRRLSTEHVGSAGQRRRADMSWAVGMREPFEEPAEALLALEFQSTPDRAMALRLAVYAALLLQKPRRRAARAPTACCRRCCPWWSTPAAGAGVRPPFPI